MPKNGWYIPQMRAEDYFRNDIVNNLNLKTDGAKDKLDSCFWNEKQRGKKPDKWETKGTKSQKVYNDKKVFDEHLKTLNDAFKSKESPFEVRKTKSMGLGVYVKNNKGFGKKEYERNYKHILIGFLAGGGKKGQFKEDSHSECEGKVRKEGRRKKGATEDEIRNLYGPIVFVNHRCERHAQFDFRQKEKDLTLYLDLKEGFTIKGNEQIFISYGNLYGDSVSCSLCLKEEKMIEKKNDKERDTAVCLPVAKRARKNEGGRNK